MITKDSSVKEILDYPLGGTTIRDVGSMTFMAWIANKLNGAPTYKASTQELLAMVRNAPMGKMVDEEKVRIVKKLLDVIETL